VQTLLDGATLASVANWADDIRNDRPETARWHYVRIPREASRYDRRRDCMPQPQGDCVLAALARLTRTLAESPQPRDRADALKFIVHFVGDLHQPLHEGDRRDRGGNDIQVMFFGEEMSLHNVWDSGIIDTTGLSVPAYAERLRGMPVGAGGGPTAWAEEAHRLAVDHAYVLPRDRRLGQAYYGSNRVVVDRQLARAGARLAALLNRILSR